MVKAITKLPFDTIVYIIDFMDIKTICNLKTTCCFFAQMFKNNPCNDMIYIKLPWNQNDYNDICMEWNYSYCYNSLWQIKYNIHTFPEILNAYITNELELGLKYRDYYTEKFVRRVRQIESNWLKMKAKSITQNQYYDIIYLNLPTISKKRFLQREQHDICFYAIIIGASLVVTIIRYKQNIGYQDKIHIPFEHLYDDFKKIL